MKITKPKFTTRKTLTSLRKIADAVSNDVLAVDDMMAQGTLNILSKYALVDGFTPADFRKAQRDVSRCIAKTERALENLHVLEAQMISKQAEIENDLRASNQYDRALRKSF